MSQTTTATPGLGEHLSLRRDVTIWGSYMWGYADVGADIYAALGLVIAAAQGMAPLAFALAGLVYVMIGLTFTELASSYPVAGGGHYYSLRGLGDFWGFVARLRCCLTTPLTLPCLRWRLLATSIFGLGTLPHAY